MSPDLSNMARSAAASSHGGEQNFSPYHFSSNVHFGNPFAEYVVNTVCCFCSDLIQVLVAGSDLGDVDVVAMGAGHSFLVQMLFRSVEEGLGSLWKEVLLCLLQL